MLFLLCNNRFENYTGDKSVSGAKFGFLSLTFLQTPYRVWLDDMRAPFGPNLEFFRGPKEKKCALGTFLIENTATLTVIWVFLDFLHSFEKILFPVDIFFHGRK